MTTRKIQFSPGRFLLFPLLCALLILMWGPTFALAQEQEYLDITGYWVVNEELSDNTDDQVEAALRASGQNARRSFFNNDKEYYRGGPAEQQLYDEMSYESTLRIERGEEEYHFTYGDDFPRQVQLGNRSRSISLNNLNQVEDFSFANWNGDTLIVEGRPRDGGFTEERYQLDQTANRLTVQLYIRPRAFSREIEITRVYDRTSP